MVDLPNPPTNIPYTEPNIRAKDNVPPYLSGDVVYANQQLWMCDSWDYEASCASPNGMDVTLDFTAGAPNADWIQFTGSYAFDAADPNDLIYSPPLITVDCYDFTTA